MNGSTTGGNGSAHTERIALTGFMGAGKSSVGPLVARLLARPFFDLDQVLAEQANLAAADILRSVGETEFRRREAEALAAIVRGTESFVLALGGGTVTAEVARRILADGHVFVVWLDVDFETVRRRVVPETRPLWSHDAEANRRLFETRRAVYAEIADRTVDGRAAPEAVARVVADVVRHGHVG